MCTTEKKSSLCWSSAWHWMLLPTQNSIKSWCEKISSLKGARIKQERIRTCQKSSAVLMTGMQLRQRIRFSLTHGVIGNVMQKCVYMRKNANSLNFLIKDSRADVPFIYIYVASLRSAFRESEFWIKYLKNKGITWKCFLFLPGNVPKTLLYLRIARILLLCHFVEAILRHIWVWSIVGVILRKEPRTRRETSPKATL